MSGASYVLTRNADLNDSSKTFTVPKGEVWIITHVNAIITASGDAGTRRMRVRTTDGTNQLSISEAGATFETTDVQTCDFYPGAPDQTTEVADTVKVAMPILILLPDHQLIVEEGEAVAAAADDMTVAFTYTKRVV